MKKKIWIAVGVVVLMIVLIAANVWTKTAGNHATVEVTSLEEEEIIETVMTPGQLTLAEEQTVYYSADKGEIAEIYVNEGDVVEAGSPLFRYENKQLELEQKQNELQLKANQLQLNTIRKQHQELDERLEEDEDNEQLQAEHDQVKLQEQQAQIEIEQTQLQKDSISEQIEALEVKSNIAGKIIEVNEQAAASSSQLEQEPLVRIGSLDQLIVEGVINEYDTLKIKEGQAVTLTADAVPDASWQGKVSVISFLPDESDSHGAESGGGGVQYPIQVTVEDENIDLKPGFQMIMEIETGKHQSETLPLTAVLQDGDESYVYVVKEGKAERREVTVGAVSAETIEITDGLTKEERVVVDPAANRVEDGMEVTVNDPS